MSDDDGPRVDPDETAVFDRRQLGGGPSGASGGAGDVPGARRWEGGGGPAPDEQTLVQPAVRLSKPVPVDPPPVARPSADAAPTQQVDQFPRSTAGYRQSPVPPPVRFDPPVERQPSPPQRTAPPRRTTQDGDVVRFPYRRPWTSTVAGILAFAWGLEAVFELVVNWSRPRGFTSGRFRSAVGTLDHASSNLADQLAGAVVGRRYVAAHAFDHRVSLGAFAVVWLIIGLLLLLARGSGITVGLLWCGIVALPALARARTVIGRFGWGSHDLARAALAGAALAPLLLLALIAGLGASRRARLHSARPSDPEFVDVNEPGAVWRDR